MARSSAARTSWQPIGRSDAGHVASALVAVRTNPHLREIRLTATSVKLVYEALGSILLSVVQLAISTGTTASGSSNSTTSAVRESLASESMLM